MIYKCMYVAYLKSGRAQIESNEKVVTATLKYFEDMAILYYEGIDESVKPVDFVKGEFKEFPCGEIWFKLMEIFHYFKPVTEEQWVRRINNKQSCISVNRLKEDKISSYIYWHFRLQENNPVGLDKFGSIYIYKDTIFMYGENPIEEITLEDVGGIRKTPLGVKSWPGLMNEHFKAWPDGEKKWIKL